LGADVGATLAKLAIRAPNGRTHFELAPARALDRVAGQITATTTQCVGLTGGGAPALATLLPSDTTAVDEFEAWAAGARMLLAAADLPREEEFLLVSLGTGTSALRVDPDSVTRVGGTALGGGTLMGLGRALTGVHDFADLAAMARDGDRRRVDLLVSDIYRSGKLPLPGDLNAASFGKLARNDAEPADPRDLAHAVVGLVGENVALVCCGLAAVAGLNQIVFGGSTLRENPALAEILVVLCLGMGREAVLLPQGEFAGALGALELANSSASTSV